MGRLGKTVTQKRRGQQAPPHKRQHLGEVGRHPRKILYQAQRTLIVMLAREFVEAPE
jgi:hypothetical protein